MIQGFKIFFLIVVVSVLTNASDVFPAEKHECDYCHITTDKMQLKTSLAELCVGCHTGRKNQDQHKVDIVPSMKIDELPLSSDGRMTCITCHDPHGKSGYANLMRVSPTKLCSKCHIM